MVLPLITFIAIVGGIISFAGTFSNFAPAIKWISKQFLRLLNTDLVRNTLNGVLNGIISFITRILLPGLQAFFVVLKHALRDAHQGIQAAAYAAATLAQENSESTAATEGATTSTPVVFRTTSPLPGIRWDTIASTSSSVLNSVSQHVRPLTTSILVAARTSPEAPTSIPMDLFEDAANNLSTAHFDVPGVTKSDIDISLMGDKLVVSYTRRVSRPVPVESPADSSQGITTVPENNTGVRYITRARPFGKFESVVQLPVGTKGDQVGANLEDGVLSISFPTVSARAHQKIAIA